MPPRSRFDRVVIAWDTASTLSETGDWSVGTVWGAVGLDYYLLDVRRARLESPELREAIVALSRRWEADATLIERTDLGQALLHELRNSKALRPILVEPRYDKLARLLAQAIRFEAGQVHLPTDAPWLGEYVGELLAFPNGKHDDQVDATSYALNYLTRLQNRIEPPVRRSRESIQPTHRRNSREDVQVRSERLNEVESPPQPRSICVPASWREGDPLPSE